MPGGPVPPLPPVPATWGSRRVTERAECILAPNPGVMTLDGTNTWVPVSYTHLDVYKRQPLE